MNLLALIEKIADLRRVFRAFFDHCGSYPHEVFGKFVALEDIDEPADHVPKSAHGMLAYLSKHSLEAREGLFDRVEVKAVGRKEAQCRASRFDAFADRGTLMA